MSVVQDSSSTLFGDGETVVVGCGRRRDSNTSSSQSSNNNHIINNSMNMSTSMEDVLDTKPSLVSLPMNKATGTSTCTTTTSSQQGTATPSTPGICSSIVDNSSSPKRLCLVCGDVASGFHYGVASCEACKAFFKRTIQGNIEYQCPASNDCEINKRRRKACQACRFQKCLRMGMLKEGVRLDRVRGGRQKYRRTMDGQSHSSPTSTSNHGHHGHHASSHHGSTQLMLSPSKRANLEDNKIVLALINCEPDPLVFSRCLSTSSMMSTNSTNSSSPNSTSSSTPSSPTGGGTISPLATFVPFSLSPAKGVTYLSDLTDRELVATISWAKNIPGFTDLILNDQMRLLQTTWGEILSLSLAYRSLIHSSSNKLIFAHDFVMDEMTAIQCKAEDMFAPLLQLTRRLAALRLVREEYLVLKALLLTNVDIPLEDSSSVSKLREALLVTLQEVVSSLRNPIPASTHLGQILLCLPLIRQSDGAIRRYWINVRKEGKVHMNKLFIEMLEAGVIVR